MRRHIALRAQAPSRYQEAAWHHWVLRETHSQKGSWPPRGIQLTLPLGARSWEAVGAGQHCWASAHFPRVSQR